MTLEIAPQKFPTRQGHHPSRRHRGVIHVESSTNLIQWQDEWVQTFANTNQNRFFRIRAERSFREYFGTQAEPADSMLKCSTWAPS